MPPAAITSTITTTAGKIIQRRATTGSVSSIFYLRQAGMTKDGANMAERTFLIGIGSPLALLGIGGLYSIVTNKEK